MTDLDICITWLCVLGFVWYDLLILLHIRDVWSDGES